MVTLPKINKVFNYDIDEFFLFCEEIIEVYKKGPTFFEQFFQKIDAVFL